MDNAIFKFIYSLLKYCLFFTFVPLFFQIQKKNGLQIG